MKRFVAILAVSLAGALPAVSQSLEDLNIQIHGYATQGFCIQTKTTPSPPRQQRQSGLDEEVVNVGAQPIPKLRVAVQVRYFLLGNYGNSIVLDWATADYKANDRFGVRFGKVKTPIRPLQRDAGHRSLVHVVALAAEVYPISSRNSQLSELGGVAYGALKLAKLGKLEYRGWDGIRSVTKDDGNFLAQRESGITLPNGISGAAEGATLRWKLPIDGLMIGASDLYIFKKTGVVVDTPTTGANQTTTNGTESVLPFSQDYFATYEQKKLMAGL
jgi:hypothetical protein